MKTKVEIRRSEDEERADNNKLLPCTQLHADQPPSPHVAQSCIANRLRNLTHVTEPTGTGNIISSSMSCTRSNISAWRDLGGIGSVQSLIDDDCVPNGN
jgi:hypothetical protein